ncbi:putative lysozyme [Chondrocystis sp. NIES-4102]|nr:putative lysozyme [Chondrocystis sp. NIES-4102]
MLNKYLNRAIIITSLGTLGFATISLAENKIANKEPDTLKDIHIHRLEHRLAVNLKNLETVPLKSAQPKPVSIHAINIIKEFEGFESQAYIDTDGRPVIGYGLANINNKPVEIGDRITLDQAEAELNRQLLKIQQELDQTVKVKLSDRQKSALASLAFNVGVKFIQDSTLVSKLNAGDYHGAANEFLRWDKANIRGSYLQLPGLTRRRQAERQLFLEQNG